MTWNFGSSSKSERGGGTQTVVLQQPDTGEQELRALNVQLAKESLADIKAARAQEAERAASPLAGKQRLLEEKATENLLARAEGRAPVLSPEEQQRLDLIYGRAQTEGEDELSRFGRDLASARGMSTADSPIGGEIMTQRRKFGEGLAASKASASLDLGNAQQLFNQQVADFQAQLAQRAFQNRLAMAGLTPSAYGLQSSLFGERYAGSPRSTTAYSSGSGSEYKYGLSGQDVAGWGSGLYGNTKGFLNRG